MSDQVTYVESGFYNSVNNDRLYYAEDMNRPYNRIISNGVYPKADGTASNDLLVENVSGALKVKVRAGEGLFGGKWFKSPSVITFDVPANVASGTRIDSVIVQVDAREAYIRKASVRYRVGTAGSGSPPDIFNTTDFYEYRLANITVGRSVTAITSNNISDLRGTSACPWVSSLINTNSVITTADINAIIANIN